MSQRWHCAGCVDEFNCATKYSFWSCFFFFLNSTSSFFFPYIEALCLVSPVWIGAWWVGSGHSTFLSDWDRMDIQEDELTSITASYVRREPCTSEIGFPAPANTLHCLVFIGNTEFSYKSLQFYGYMNLLYESLLRITVSNQLYQCKELLPCPNLSLKIPAVFTEEASKLFVRVHAPWLPKPSFKLIQLYTVKHPPREE